MPYRSHCWIFNQYRQMTAHLKLPVSHRGGGEPERIEDHVSDGSISRPVIDSPPMNTAGMLDSGVCTLSTISEQGPHMLDVDPGSRDPPGGREWVGSSSSVCSDRFKNSSSCFSSDDSYQRDSGDDCAALLLACLHCRFHELWVLLLDACERAVGRCVPSYKYVTASGEGDRRGKDCCNYKLELDCNCCGSCQDAGELIELAMEISEVCYR